MNRHLRFVVGVLVLAAGTLIGTAAPNRYGHSDRVERHMLPSLSTTPLDPAWSPDGKWIAFSMRGDIWKVPAEGGEAVALTKGPAYHYEPAWSPDGSRLALTMDVDGNLDIGVVSASGGEVERLTTERRVDVEPAWSHDGASLYFVTARTGNFDIYRYRFADRSETPFITGPRDQIQPTESPDGQRVAFVSPLDGRLGTGGIWLKPIASGEPTLVHYEESEYRMQPEWTPDGQAILYGSDEAGSNDIAMVPVTGGNPITLRMPNSLPTSSMHCGLAWTVSARAGVPPLNARNSGPRSTRRDVCTRTSQTPTAAISQTRRVGAPVIG
jgi:Tol biopolymer transport system component